MTKAEAAKLIEEKLKGVFKIAEDNEIQLFIMTEVVDNENGDRLSMAHCSPNFMAEAVVELLDNKDVVEIINERPKRAAAERMLCDMAGTEDLVEAKKKVYGCDGDCENCSPEDQKKFHASAKDFILRKQVEKFGMPDKGATIN